MLLLGSTGRNSGKTVLACALIRHLSRQLPVVGLKVTTIHGTGDVCPRGGEGCGVCSSLEGDYCVTLEKDTGTEKDTEKMVRAGAEKVYWLRVRAGKMDAAVGAIKDLIPPGTPVVAESNSLRLVVEPGLFLIMNPMGSTTIKPSAKRVLEFADRVVEGDEAAPGIDARGVFFEDGEFFLKREVTLLLLAGGGSSRMGVPKSSLDYQGVPLIVHVHNRLAPMFSEVLISVSGDEKLPSELAHVKKVVDVVSGRGPIAGIAAGLDKAGNDTVFVAACDIPTIDRKLVTDLLKSVQDFDVVVPRTKEGHFEPLFAVYAKRVLPGVLELMDSGERRIRMLYDTVKTCYKDLEPGQQLFNVNTPEEYLQI
jgi:molybdopterin-guanine dinucleotide biosynthesis protein A